MTRLDLPVEVRELLVLSDEQRMLFDTALKFVDKEAPVARFRARRDAGELVDAELWDQMTELGWPAIPVAEDAGGLGMSLADCCVLLEALGRNLVLSPMLSIPAAALLAPEGLAEGRVVALGTQENPDGASEKAVQSFWRDGALTGFKARVLDACAASRFVVTAKDGADTALFVVDGAHVTRHPLIRLDHRDCAHIRFDAAPAEKLDLDLGTLRHAIEHSTVALSAHMLGGAQAVFDLTLAYLKERVQFDKPIGAFQALQHRAVDVYIAIETARSAVLAASRNPAPALVSLAKARVNDAYLHAANEAVQMFGGIGMTDEHDAGLYLKRARVASETLGNSRFHRDRWARLRSY